MPEPIWNPDTSDRQGSIAERVLGSSEKARATKTWMPNTILVGRTGLLRNYAHGLLITFRALHMEMDPQGKPKTDDELLKMYPGIAAYHGLSTQLDDRLVSHKGFGIKSVFGRDDPTEAPTKKDSSAGLEDLPKTESPTQDSGMKMR